jgi:hypothetical protein
VSPITDGNDSDDGDDAGPVRVPHVVGHHIDVALRRLQALGLTARIVTTEVHDKTDRHVVSTSPPAGALARRSLVELVVGIAPCVDGYLGRDADEAIRRAERAGHVVEVVVEVLADDHHDGHEADHEQLVVIGQEPDVGERSRVLLLHLGRRDDTTSAADRRPPPAGPRPAP